MLEAARNVRAAGTDVVVGYVEPHGRVETERLLEGLPRLPTLAVRYRGIVRQEFDLDAALARHPGDPAGRRAGALQSRRRRARAAPPQALAGHRGAAGGRHDVWTTVNVQHLESLNDLVCQITGIRQRETLPDHVFDEADEVELIDLPPDDLLARLHAGKVYVASQAGDRRRAFLPQAQPDGAARARAAPHGRPRRGGLARAAGRSHPGARLARDRVLVAIGPDEQAEQLVRAGKRIADALDAQWSVVYVETPSLLRLSEAQRNRRIDVLRLAESLGAETVTLDGPSAADALVEYAQTRHATRVIVGSPKRRGWRAWLRPSTATELARRARGFDIVQIASAGPAPPAARAASGLPPPAPTAIRWDRYSGAGLVTATCTLMAWAMYPHFELSNLVMVYLLGVTVAGLKLGRGPSALTALLNVAAFDFFFVPPRFSFAVSDVQYLVTFGAMVTIALVIATLTASVRQQTRVAGARERRTALLYAMSRELSVTRGIDSMARLAVRHVAEVFQCQATVLLPDAAGKLHYPAEAPLETSFRGADLAVAQWVADNGRRAGLGSDTLPAARGLYVPLGDERRTVGVLAVLPDNARRVLLPEQGHLLETFAGQIALALERAHLGEVAVQASLAAERETLRNTLLSSISHDLRTPLAVMAGAGSALAQHGATLDEATRVELARSIETTAREMSELVSNVLDLVRLESGQVALRRDWQTLDDLVGSALTRYQESLRGYQVETRLAAELPPVWVDGTLVVQLFANLFDNIAKYTPPGTRVSVSAVPLGDFVQVAVEDDGPGLPAGDPARLFDKFQRGQDEGAVIGVGLGLAIAQAIVRAHGGEIEAQRRDGGGARFVFTLPCSEGPAVAPDASA